VQTRMASVCRARALLRRTPICSTGPMSLSWRQRYSRRSGGGGWSFGARRKRHHAGTSLQAGSSLKRLSPDTAAATSGPKTPSLGIT